MTRPIPIIVILAKNVDMRVYTDDYNSDVDDDVNTFWKCSMLAHGLHTSFESRASFCRMHQQRAAVMPSTQLSTVIPTTMHKTSANEALQ